MVLIPIISKLILAAAILSNSCLFGKLRERRAKLRVERANTCVQESVQSTSVQVQGTSVQVGGIPVLDITINWF
jgi:hypothetical protein